MKKKLYRKNNAKIWFIRRHKNAFSQLYYNFFIAQKILISLKIIWIILKLVFPNAFSRTTIEFFFKKIQLIIFTAYKDEKFKAWKK